MEKPGQYRARPFRDELTRTTVRSGILAFLVVFASSACSAASPLPDGYVNSPYNSNTVTCDFGEGCAVTVLKGQLPPGVSLTNNVLQGAPTQAGLYSFTMEFTTTRPGGSLPE